MDRYLDVFGRLHPLLLHLPIGLMVGVVALEATAWWRGRESGRAPTVLLWLTAAAAVAAVATGLVLSYEDGYGGSTLTTHLWLGIAFGVFAVVAAVLRSMEAESRPAAVKLYRGSLAVAVVLMMGAGHFGAAMTHGANFLFEPLGSRTVADGGGASEDLEPITFESLAPAAAEGFGRVQPIFAQKCSACHSGAVSKAGLNLDSFESLVAGSEAGSILDPENPAAGELLRRLKVPLDDPDHMPPEGKRQLSASELATIEAWIVGGSPAGGDALADSATATQPVEGAAETAAPATPEVPAADPAAVAALAETLAHVSAVAENSQLLWVDVSYANPPLPEAKILELLEPLAGNVAELSLARCDISDATAGLLARMPHLRRLNLSGTAVTDATIAALAGHAGLREIVLTDTTVTDASVEGLLAIPGLEHAYLWNTQVTAEGVGRLEAARADLVADAGEFAQSSVLEVEPEPKFGAATAPAANLTASNTMCPVSGAPVDQKYLVVYEGRVIGFCCPDCPKQFWADPAKFIEKLKP
jgi:uncharacterized membrane protein/YHS domain-containing protein